MFEMLEYEMFKSGEEDVDRWVEADARQKSKMF